MFVKLEEVFGSSINPINEAFHYTGEKEFHKAFAKATGFKTHAGGYFGPAIGSAHIKINLYDCLEYNKRLPRPGVYGDLEIKRVTPMNEYEQAEMDIVYQGVEMKCGIGCFYPPRVAKAKNKQVIDLVLKQAGIKADYEIVIKAYQPYIELSEENFNKIAKIKVGDKIGDFLVYDAGIEDKKSVEQFYIIMTSYKEQLAMFATKNPAINESTSLNESVKVFNDAAKLIAGYLNIKFKPTGTPDVFEVSGRDRMKIEKLQEGDILDNNMMVDGIVDDNYTVNIELIKPGLSRAIIVRFTDEPEMFESTLFADLNSVDEKTLKDIVKSTFKVLGTKVGRDVSVYDNCIEVTTGLITTAKLEAGVIKMGSYSGIKFVSYEEGKSGKYDRLIVEYNGELYPIAFQVYTGYADLRFAKAGELLKDFSKKYRISTDNADVNPYSKANTLIQVSEAEFKKLPSLVHRGDTIGDAVVVGVGEDSGETRLFRGKNFHVTIVTPKHQAGFTFIPENYVSGLREDEAGDMNESTVELNEVTGLPKHKTSVPSHLL